MTQIGDIFYDTAFLYSVFITMATLFVIVLGLWIWGQFSPKIKRFRISALVSFILLCATVIIFFVDSMRESTEANFFLFTLPSYIVLLPSGFLTWFIWKFLSAADFHVAEDSIECMVLIFSFAINSFIIFGIIKLARYIRKKYFTTQANTNL